jgi:Rho-type GTPase-activating protein 1/2
VDETPEQPASKLSRTLTTRLDKLRAQYERELVPLTEEREALAREILELKAARDVFLEETTVLNARNEELAQLGSQYVRRMDTVPEISVKPAEPATPQRQPPPASLGVPVPYIRPESMVDDVMIIDQRMKLRLESEAPTPKKFNLWGRKDTQAQAAPPATPEKSKLSQNQNQHNFQHLSILRLTRCDQCGDKMWGSQLRCSGMSDGAGFFFFSN